ncbi:histidine phosphatase family protein [bacterium]|nr:histidine phosphatase family protein [bacterium]
MRLLLALVLAVVGTVAVAADPPAKGDVVPAVQKGGYVLFLRHPQSNPDQADTDPLNLDNVNAQRHLTDAGREQAKALGLALKKLKVPVGKVLASKFHRTQETAKLLDLGEVETSVDVTEGGLVVSPKENQRRAAALRKLLGTTPLEGKNVVIVSHKPNLQDAAGKEFGDLGEGELVVFQPLGDGKFKLVARVHPSAMWSEWAK